MTTLDEVMAVLQWAKTAGATQVKVGDVEIVFGIPNSKSESDLIREKASQIMNRESASDARAYFDNKLFGGSLDRTE